MAETKLPAIPDPSSDPAGFYKAVHEIVQVREGVRGEPLDRGVTLRDLVDIGLAAPQPRFAGSGRVPAGRIVAAANGGGPDTKAMTVPPVPRDFVAVGTFTSILLRWSSPGYSNHAYTEVLRADVDDIGQAVIIGESTGGQYADAVGESADKYYWIRFVSTASVKGPAAPSVHGKTALDPEYVMANLLSVVWEPNTAYSEFQYVRSTVDNGFLYRCTTAGISGATEPGWPVTVGVTYHDNTVTWITAPMSERVPFMIGTVNGQPAVVIDSAYIGDATITTAKIKNAFLDNLTAIHGTLHFARIEQGNIFDLTIGGQIRSVNYYPAVIGGKGFILRNNAGPGSGLPGSTKYVAEFFGDSYFGGDVYAARILAGMIVGSVFGVPSDADNGSYEFICLRELLQCAEYGSRADPRVAYPYPCINCPDINGNPTSGTQTRYFGVTSPNSSPAPYMFLGYPPGGTIDLLRYCDPAEILGVRTSREARGKTSGNFIPVADLFGPSYDFMAWYWGFNSSSAGPALQSKIRTNPLNIIAWNEVNPRQYRRYRHRNVPVRIDLIQNAFVDSQPTLTFLVKSGTSMSYPHLVVGFYKKAAPETSGTYYHEFTINGVPVTTTVTVLSVPSGTNYANYTLKHTFNLGWASGELIVDLPTPPHPGTPAGYDYCIIKAGGFIQAAIPFDAQYGGGGLYLEVDNQKHSRISGPGYEYDSAEFSTPTGLDMAVKFTSAMDNNV